MEKVKEFRRYIIMIALTTGGYLMRDYPEEKFRKLRSIKVRGNEYQFTKEGAFTLHGWYPFLKENRWNAWRQTYNMLYRYFVPVGLFYFEQPEAPSLSIPVLPMTWSIKAETWTPTLVQAVNLSKREEQYNRKLRPAFSNFNMSWKTMLIVGVIIVVALLVLTGRLPI